MLYVILREQVKNLYFILKHISSNMKVRDDGRYRCNEQCALVSFKFT